MSIRKKQWYFDNKHEISEQMKTKYQLNKEHIKNKKEITSNDKKRMISHYNILSYDETKDGQLTGKMSIKW